MERQSYYITTPIYYVNDMPHIGHAYTSVACDAIARFKKMQKDKYGEVFFLTGTDEHGNKVDRSAQKKGVDTQSFVDNLVPHFKKLHSDLSCDYDYFIRTTDGAHKAYVQDIWRRLNDAGAIYLGKYEGWYSVRDECFYQEGELIDGLAPTGSAVEWVEEESYFFKLSKFQDKLLDFYNKNPDFIKPEGRRKEVLSFVKGGLLDLSISRTSFSWGIPVPIRSEGANDEHVIYVWLDALFNYMSALDAAQKSELWPADVHVVGKDILIFHAVYWPAFLMALDLPLPRCIFAHGWWTNDGQKISKSLGNVIDPIALSEKYGSEYLRYFMLREVPFGKDGNYSDAALMSRINGDLVNNIGNLLRRALVLIESKHDSRIPIIGTLEQNDEELLEDIILAKNNFVDRMSNFEIHLAIEEIIKLGAKANVYINHKAPWKDEDKSGTTLNILTYALKAIGIMLQPFVPISAGKILDAIGIEERGIVDIDERVIPGGKIYVPEIIFNRITE